MRLFPKRYSKAEVEEIVEKTSAKNFEILQSRILQGFYNTVSPSSVQSLVKQGYQQNATVFSIIDTLIKSACNIPYQVYEVKNKSALSEYNTLIKGLGNDFSYLKAQTARERALMPLESHPLHDFMANPHPMMGYSEWLQEVLGFKYLTGNSFMRGHKRSGTGVIYKVDVWPAQFTRILFNKQVQILGYQLNVNGRTMDAPLDEVAHIKNFNPDYSIDGSHFYGQSPLKAAEKNLKISNNSVLTGHNIIVNQGARGILQPKGDSMDYTADEAKQLESKYKEKHTLQGRFEENSKVMFPSRELSWINMSQPAGDLALMEQYNVSTKDLCGVYNFPSILLNDTAESKVESYREAKKYMYQQGVFPELISLRDELNRWLVPTYGTNLYLDYDFLSVPEIQEDMEKITKQLNLMYWLSFDEKRKAIKYAPIGGELGNSYQIPANLLSSNDWLAGEIQGGDPET